MLLSEKNNCKNCKFAVIFGKVSSLAVFFIFTVFSFLTFSLLSPIVSSNAEDSSASAGSSAYVASISANNSVSLSATPTNTQTIFSGTNTITYTNTCPYGFNVTISSSSSDTNLTRLGSDSGPKTIPTIASGTALDNNTWGYSTDSGSTYNPIPALASPVNIINTSSATTNPATLNILYGVKINNTIPSGDYSNDVVYTVSVKPQCLTYTLSFDLDDGIGATGVDYSDQVLNYGQTIDLTSYTPTKNGFNFTGWSNGTDTFTGSETNADVNLSNSPAVTLTAQWEQNGVGIHSITTMQEMTPAICTETTKPLTSATRLDTDGSHHGDDTYVPRAILRDTRDDNYYIVSKLADGNCWMNQNLELDLEQDEPVVISNNDGTTGSFTPENSTKTAAGDRWDNSSAGSYRPVVGGNGSVYYQNGVTGSNTSSVPGDRKYDWEKTGTYYNWYAATGGTGTAQMTLTDAPSSICPMGWRLPPQSGAKSYNNLISTVYGISSSPALIAAPFNFVIAGMYREYGSVYLPGQVGNYWQATASSFASEAYKTQINYNFSGYDVYLQNTSIGKQMGATVRCVAI